MKKFSAVLLSLMLILLMVGCGKVDVPYAYDVDLPLSSYNINSELHSTDLANPFASNLCVVDANIPVEGLTIEDADAAALFDVNNKQVIYAKNVHGKVYPASLTKVLTALVALKHGSMDQTLTASSNVEIKESRAQLIGLKAGDTMTLDQALHILLMYSANDAAVLIAEGLGGSVEAFSEMMNEEAVALGATNSNFVNANGLSNEEHYTTAYDLYLIFNEAVKYDLFNEIISMTNYSTIYYDKNGKEKKADIKTTNGFISGNVTSPGNVTVIGGKTGTTAAAGHCLILLSKNTSGQPYISVVMASDSTEELYQDMTNLLLNAG